MILLSTPSIAQERSSLEIDWKAAAAARRPAATEKLRGSGAKSSEIANTKLPILIIESKDVRGAPSFSSQGTAYAATYILDKEARLSILGSATGIVVSDPSMPPATDVPQFEVTEDGAEISFLRFGAAYTIRLACDVEVRDSRCTEPAFLTNIAEQLVVANGE